ncbi:MAG: YggS family pyridoxal phosphate-dependent enzyme [Campylobacteraceae bacterium]
MSKESILQNIDEVLKRIELVCKNCGRNKEEVKLLLATKTVSSDDIKIALSSGQTLIAENKVQELKSKYEDLKDVLHVNHFIGHLQTNKIKDILKCDVKCIESVDRLDLALKLHEKLKADGKTMEIFIEVNTSGEASKFGVELKDAVSLAKEISKLDSLHVKGLMTIGLFSDDEVKVRECFKKLKNLLTTIKALNLPNFDLKELSMGMSGDLEIAIEEGSTIVRVGSAIFGARNYH